MKRLPSPVNINRERRRLRRRARHAKAAASRQLSLDIPYDARAWLEHVTNEIVSPPSPPSAPGTPEPTSARDKQGILPFT